MRFAPPARRVVGGSAPVYSELPSKKKSKAKKSEKGLVALLAKAQRKANKDADGDESDSSSASLMMKAVEGVSGSASALLLRHRFAENQCFREKRVAVQRRWWRW